MAWANCLVWYGYIHDITNHHKIKVQKSPLRLHNNDLDHNDVLQIVCPWVDDTLGSSIAYCLF